MSLALPISPAIASKISLAPSPSPTCGEMLGTVVAAVVEKVDEGGGTHLSPERKQQIQVPDTKEPTSEVGAEKKKKEKNQVPTNTAESGGAMINKEQTHLLVVPEEKDALKNLELKKNKEKKRKRSDLVQIKKEQQLCGAEKTQVPADTEDPTSESGDHKPTSKDVEEEEYLLASKCSTKATSVMKKLQTLPTKVLQA